MQYKVLFYINFNIFFAFDYLQDDSKAEKLHLNSNKIKKPS